ncbi:MAG TPA: sulfur carrier protein ThiS [Capsulimonadaceae bacterium]
MITITVNGDERQLNNPKTLSEFLAECGIPERIVVIEHNGVIIARPKFGETTIQEGDNLEIVQMMAGG